MTGATAPTGAVEVVLSPDAVILTREQAQVVLGALADVVLDPWTDSRRVVRVAEVADAIETQVFPERLGQVSS